MTTHAAVVAAALAMLATCWPSEGAISVDEARKVAEQYAGTSLSDSYVDCAGGICARFGVPSDGGSTIYSVDLVTGKFSGYSHPYPAWKRRDEGEPCPAGIMGEREAEAIAKAEAKRLMGDAYGNLDTWEVRMVADRGYADVRGEGPKLGDPPREVLPTCLVSVSLLDGSIVCYLQAFPLNTDPVPLKVSEEEAISIARTAMGDRSAKVAKPPFLYQDPHKERDVTWHVQLVGDRGSSSSVPEWGGALNDYTIDALTGTIVRTTQPTERSAASAEEPERPVASRGASALMTSAVASPATGPATGAEPTGLCLRRMGLPLAIVSASVLLCAGGTLVLLRRRR